MSKGLAKVRELFWYTDSQQTEILVAFCHIVALPACLIVEFDNPSILLLLGGIFAGIYQLYSVVWLNRLKHRLIAVQLASIIAIMTVINLAMAGLLEGSRVGWCIIMFFAFWNTIRVFKEKIERYG